MRSPAFLHTNTKNPELPKSSFIKGVVENADSTDIMSFESFQGVVHSFGKINVHSDNKFTASQIRVQPKLQINQPGDAYEREADVMADKIMRMKDTTAIQAFPNAAVSPVQRKCAACEEEEKELNRKESSSSVTPTVSPAVEQTIQSSGQPMDKSTRSFMEQRFGYDFGNVQIHNDALAHQSSKDINALAYTYKNHVVFGVGRYQPNTNTGKQLLAHELVHVRQQGVASRIACSNSVRNLILGKGIDTKTDVTPLGPGIQRRNGHRPPRRPVVPSRGRHGQREGQRLPPRTRAERSRAFERREREKVEAARRRFDEMVKQSQKFLEQWAKEGSEPKTAAQKAFRILVKTLELWDELSSKWEDTHSEFERITWRRVNLDKSDMRADWDKRFADAVIALRDFNVEMLKRLIVWQEQMDDLGQWFASVEPSIGNKIKLAGGIFLLLLDAFTIGSELHDKLARINKEIIDLSFGLPFPMPNYGQSSISNPD